MRFEVGKTYLTRDGCEALIDCVNEDSSDLYPVSGHVDGFFEMWTATGAYRAGREHELDLMQEQSKSIWPFAIAFLLSCLLAFAIGWTAVEWMTAHNYHALQSCAETGC